MTRFFQHQRNCLKQRDICNCTFAELFQNGFISLRFGFAWCVYWSSSNNLWWNLKQEDNRRLLTFQLNTCWGFFLILFCLEKCMSWLIETIFRVTRVIIWSWVSLTSLKCIHTFTVNCLVDCYFCIDFIVGEVNSGFVSLKPLDEVY